MFAFWFFSLATCEKFTTGSVQLFDNLIDHFSATNKDTFKQRFYVNETFVNATLKSIPTFIFLGGEAPFEFFEFQEVSAFEWAKQFGARYISLEHRYYGDSLPTPTYDTKSLMQFLNVDQALADAAYFIEQQLKAHPDWAGRWVVFGCSYSGALAAFFRLKYPQFVVGAVAPSGPVEAQMHFPQYLQRFSQVAPPTCVSAVRKGFSMMTSLLALGENAYLASLFNSCDNNLTDARDLWNFKYTLAGGIGSVDQFDNPVNPRGEGGPWPLNATCALIESAVTPVLGIATALGAGNDGQGCVDYSYAAMMAPLLDVTSQARAWQFQCCHEFGFWQSTTGSIFFDDITTEQINALCEPIFGIGNMSPNTAAFNAKYGGKAMNVSDVIFTNGRYDPWAQLSITTARPGIDVAVYDAGHCAPMTAASSDDPPSLTQARVDVHNFLLRVLG